MMSVLNIIIVFIKLKNNINDSRVYASYKKIRDDQIDMFEYLETCLLEIEIVDSNKKKQTIIFPKYPVFNSLTGNLRDTVMGEVSRTTHRDKIVSLLGFTGAIKSKI